MQSILLALALLFSSYVHAAERVNRNEGAISTSASHEIAVGVSDTAWLTDGESLSAMFSISHDWLQAYLGVYKTKNDVDFAAGGAYKFTLAGTRANGFHVGPGATLGSVGGDFGFAVFATLGGHFTLIDHLLLSFDAGPMVTHTEENTNFRFRPLGNLLGLSLFYVF